MRFFLPVTTALLCLPFSAIALGSDASGNIGITNHYLGYLCILVFVLAYALVMVEEYIHLPKSKPVIFAAGLIWLLVAYLSNQDPANAPKLEQVLQHTLTEYAALFLFLLVAMTYINSMAERGIFQALRLWLVGKEFSYRKLFWITGGIAFFLSPIADNLTTALLMGAVVISVGSGNAKFIAVACVNIVVAANAGGAFSPFGDITTLMVWQSGRAEFFDFFALFLPAVVNFIVPASIMSLTIDDKKPAALPQQEMQQSVLKRGAFNVCGLFIATIVTAVSLEKFMHLPPYLGMMLGLSYLAFYAYYVKMTSAADHDDIMQFNLFNRVAQAEWDTLLFFFGIIFCVGGLGYIGYLEIMSSYFYTGWGPTVANIVLGVISAVIDNIPVMFAILTMNPEMDHYQWLLITLTAGVGGSLLSIGSAAGVALMGQARGIYTFVSHLKWSWAIALGYSASIYVHYLLNS